MDNNMVGKIWVEMSTTNIHLLQFKIQNHLQKWDFECQNVRSHSKENPSKISNITFAILPFSYQNTFK